MYRIPLLLLPFASLSSARPERMRPRSNTNPNTCPCPPVQAYPATVTETLHGAVTTLRETVTECITVTEPAKTQTVIHTIRQGDDQSYNTHAEYDGKKTVTVTYEIPPTTTNVYRDGGDPSRAAYDAVTRTHNGYEAQASSSYDKDQYAGHGSESGYESSGKHEYGTNDYSIGKDSYNGKGESGKDHASDHGSGGGSHDSGKDGQGQAYHTSTPGSGGSKQNGDYGSDNNHSGNNYNNGNQQGNGDHDGSTGTGSKDNGDKYDAGNKHENGDHDGSKDKGNKHDDGNQNGGGNDNNSSKGGAHYSSSGKQEYGSDEYHTEYHTESYEHNESHEHSESYDKHSDKTSYGQETHYGGETGKDGEAYGDDHKYEQGSGHDNGDKYTGVHQSADATYGHGSYQTTAPYPVPSNGTRSAHYPVPTNSTGSVPPCGHHDPGKPCVITTVYGTATEHITVYPTGAPEETPDCSISSKIVTKYNTVIATLRPTGGVWSSANATQTAGVNTVNGTATSVAPGPAYTSGQTYKSKRTPKAPRAAFAKLMNLW
ncbi:predicted protein [Verticillium alfalfae VaMs.102]|uniref:Predicted protein n=1 Tax=Verticillium alfalfae (strain VaMs.102 / ATCC MYA-4576 / FGSC 10136) TaxID=526221 RepID=C9SYM8_VERA1|nr:predicted protein [Verticillium alfalfae VaMs.102]EEY23893.1 predicted protein [Verticillium alfalfae VaMs.102]